MQMTFEVTVEVDEATPGEIEEAIADCLRALEMPNGDHLYIDFPSVSYLPPNVQGERPERR